jgi:hypothetical protein
MKAWLSLGVLAAVVVGCSPSGPQESSDTGTGRVWASLSGTGTDGATYRIVGWTLHFEGPESLVVPETSDDPVTVSLKAGSYTVALEGGWHIERADAPGVPVDVQLVSPNPLGFVVRDQQDTALRFIFKLPLEGTASVTMGVDSGGWISGTFQLQETADPNATHTFDALIGVPVPFTISYEMGHVQRSPVRTTIDTGPIAVQFGGPANSLLDEEYVEALSGQNISLELTAAGEDGVSVFVGPLMSGGPGPAYALDLVLPVLPGAFDENGSPKLGVFVASAEIHLTKGEAVATGTASVTVVAR